MIMFESKPANDNRTSQPDSPSSKNRLKERITYLLVSVFLLEAIKIFYPDGRKFPAQIEAAESRVEASMERDGELVPASAELRTEDFKTWAGDAEIATIAIVFTDMVGGTELNVELGDERWQQVSKAHFTQSQKLIRQGRGYLLKTKGDGVIAAFHDAGAALDFALTLSRDTGSERVRIRAGIHIGPVVVSTNDVFGQQVDMVSRIEAKAQKGGVWVSAKIKEDISIRNSARHQHLKWTEHPGEVLKGFPGLFTLWSVEESNI
jgi:class 3 adenylate cyclase